MKTSDIFGVAAPRARIDWSEVKDRLDVAMVATNLLGPAARRQGSRLHWCCPFHDDHDPSFQVDLSRKTWRCWVCAIGGDAAELVKRINHCDFPTAVKFLAEMSGVLPSSGKIRGQKPPPPYAREVLDLRPGTTAKPARPPSEQPSGLPLDEASTLVAEAVGCLWGPGGENALAYLHRRDLTEPTIRAAGLGWTPGVMIPTRAGDRAFWFSGIVIPWRAGGTPLGSARLTRIKIRRLDDGKPKYAEAFQDNPLIYPDPSAVRPGKPLIICEGEFDCLLLAQQLPEASVITLGSASARTDPAVLSKMVSSPRLFIALDGDPAGDSAAARFPASAIRVRPPAPDKDWGEVHAGGANRIRYLWGRLLNLATPWEKLEPKGELSQ